MVISKIPPAVVSTPILKDNNVWRNECFDCLKIMLLEGYFKAVDDLSDARFWIMTAQAGSHSRSAKLITGSVLSQFAFISSSLVLWSIRLLQSLVLVTADAQFRSLVAARSEFGAEPSSCGTPFAFKSIYR